MKFPATSDEMRKAGYQYKNDGTCRKCGAPIEWWITPNGKNFPASVSKPDPLHSSQEFRISHFQDCPNAEDFRK